MILVELEDIRRIHSRNPFNPDGPTEYRFTPGERPLWLDEPDMFETEKRFYPGPYLVRVNENAVWLSRDGETWEEVVCSEPYPCVERDIWHDYVTLYAEAIGISTRALLTRYYWMWRELKKTPDEWIMWKKIYHWPEGSDLVWSGFLHHYRYETREQYGRKEIRYVSR